MLLFTRCVVMFIFTLLLLLRYKTDDVYIIHYYMCYGTELVTVTICCFIAAQEMRLGLHRSDLHNSLKINFSAVFDLNKIDELKTARNGKNKLKLTKE